MANTIKIKRGQSANISGVVLQEGELAVTLDTGELYVGDGTENKQIATSLPNATETTVGGIKCKLVGTTLYITTDGSAPGA